MVARHSHDAFATVHGLCQLRAQARVLHDLRRPSCDLADDREVVDRVTPPDSAPMISVATATGFPITPGARIALRASMNTRTTPSFDPQTLARLHAALDALDELHTWLSHVEGSTMHLSPRTRRLRTLTTDLRALASTFLRVR
jgi:hypothetical protein